MWRSSGRGTQPPCFQDMGLCNCPEVTRQEPLVLWVLKTVHCMCACMYISERRWWGREPLRFWETHRSWLHLDNHNKVQIAVCQGVLAAQHGVGQVQRPSSFRFHNHDLRAKQCHRTQRCLRCSWGCMNKEDGGKKHWLSHVPSQVGT